MKAAFIQHTGPPDVIQIGDLPDPQISPEQVLIRSEAAAVNPIDTYVRRGTVAMDLPTPFIPGSDVAGTVVQVGSNVTGFRTGDRVWATNQGLLGRQGTLSQLVAVDAKWVYELPDGVEAADAAACALTGVTAHLGLTRVGAKANETILVIGASGGVGSMVVQMANALGLKVIGTAGGPEKRDAVIKLGADEVIDYLNSSILDQIQQLAPEGIEILWETRREPDFEFAVQALAHRGRMILMAGRDARPEFPVGPFYVNECSLHGVVMFRATADEMRQAADDMNGWLSSGQLKPLVRKSFPLDQAVAAHQLQEKATLEGTAAGMGKILIHFP